MKRLVLLAMFASGCGGTTGSALVTFGATASGPIEATGGPLSFTTGLGAEVTLTHASMHIGAVYLNQSVPASGAAAEPCISPGIYVGEVFGPIDVDLLSPTPQRFPLRGEGTQTGAKTAEVWLTGGDVNAKEDPTVILNVEGTAAQDAQTFPFTASITIGSNRQQQTSNPALPGANPICHKRIVTPILVDITPTDGGTLMLRIDPRAMFNGVDFTKLTEVSATPPQYLIPDDSSTVGTALFKGMFANSGVYSFTWAAAGP